MGAAMSITAFPVLARMLTEHRMVGTRVGALALASAAVDDVLAWCLLALVAAIVSATGGSGDLVQILPFEVLSEGVKRPFDGISIVLLPVFFIVTGLNVDVSALSGRALLELVGKSWTDRCSP